jgi:hypothetical protein
VDKISIMDPPIAVNPKRNLPMKPHPTRHWTVLLALGVMIGLTGCESDEFSQSALTGVSAVGATTLISQVGQVPSSAPADETTEMTTPAAPEVEPLPVPAPTVAPPPLPPGVDEVVQLAQTQIGDEVLLAYIDNSPARFELDIEQILYLHDLGLSAQVIAAMVRHNQDLADPDSLIDEETPSVAAALASVEATPDIPPAQAMEPNGLEAPTAAAVSTEPAVQQVTHNHFYTALSPYGTWVEVPEYGWSWRPTVSVIDPHWRPYVHGGRWIHTDYGWYWHSYYSWGWAPFHYGRWHLSSRNGWVWVPDTRWGPAWVSWRYYDGYYGWAPLPPRAIYTSGIGLTYYGRHVGFGFSFGLGASWYSFVPVGHFYSSRPWYHCAPHSRVTQIYNNSTVINNYIVGDNNTTIINVGPGTDSIAAATRTEIQKVQIQDINPAESKTIRAESLSRDGTTLAAYRPQLPTQAPAPPPEVTRRQAELQRRTETVANSDAAQSATIRARQPDSLLGRQAIQDSANRGRPTASPRVVRIQPDPTTGRPVVAPVSPRTGSPAASRTEPQARPSVPRTPAASGTSGTIRSGETIQRAPAGAPVARPTTPSRPSTAPSPAPPRVAEPRRTVTPQPAPTRPEPQASRVQPAPQVPVAPRIPNQSIRVEPVRPSNPSYSVTPRSPSTQPAPNRFQPAAPRYEPPARRTYSQPPPAAMTPSRPIAPRPSFTPSTPRQVAPARSIPSPAPAVRAPTVQPRSTSPGPASAPVRAPSRPSPAPAQPARGAGSR